MEEVFAIQISPVKSSQDIRKFFQQRAEQQKLQNRYHSKSKMLCVKYLIEEPVPPYDLKTIERIEKEVHNQQKLHTRLSTVLEQAGKLDVVIPELEQPLQNVDIVEQENRMSLIQEIHDVWQDIKDIGYHNKKIKPELYSKKYLRELQVEYQTQRDLLKRYQRYQLEFERMGLDVETREFPFEEDDIKTLEENMEYQYRWAKKFFEIKQSLWKHQRRYRFPCSLCRR